MVKKEMRYTLFYEQKLQNYLHCIILFSLKGNSACRHKEVREHIC